jgi:arylsulfatase A-like enzyme
MHLSLKRSVLGRPRSSAPSSEQHVLIFMILFICMCCHPNPVDQDLPNVVFILADDMGWGDVAAYNPESLIPTPHIDRLAEEGLSYSDAHSGGALCTPTRYGILTGRFYWRTHKKHSLVMPYDPPVIPPERLTWGKLMQECGYTTCYIGKWHLGLWYPSQKTEGWARQYTMNEDEVDFSKPIVGGPCDLGFDFFFGTAGCSSSDSPYCFIRNDRWVSIPTMSTPQEMNEQPGVVPGLMAADWAQTKVDTTLAAEAVDFIQRQRSKNPDKPFFLYFALSTPHIPWVVPEFMQGASKEGPRGDMNALVDWCVGEVLKTLEQQGILDDTLLIFTSDNGPRKGANGHRSAGPFRGYKNSAYEGGHRVPFIVRWPNKIAAAVRSEVPISLNDMLATFAGFLDYELPEDAAEDSIDISSYLFYDQADVPQRPALMADTGSHVADLANYSIRRDNWKLIEINPQPSNKLSSTSYELYDLSQDPYETKNLVEAYPEVTEELQRLLKASRKKGLRFLE